MNKETLSSYGWIVVVVIIGAIILASATPFGQVIFSGINGTAATIYNATENTKVTETHVDTIHGDWGQPDKC